MTTVGAPSGTARVQDPATSDVTVSEGIGYGMLIAVYMADKTLFDELWGYAKANFDGHSLMNWKIDATGAVDGAGSATDADEDIAWSLLMADAQWGGYTSAAQGYIGAIASSGEIHDNIPNIGDNSPTATTIHPDYVAPAYYPKFGSSFSGAVAAGYALLDSVRDGTTGLVPDDSSPTGPNGTTSFGYEASRVPLRVGLDFCLNGSSSAQSILTAEVAYFSGVGAANLKLPIPIAGGAGQDPSGAISGPAGVAAMVSASNQAFLDASWLDTYKITLPANNSNNYFGSSLGVISMLVMGGNFLDYTSL